MMMETINSINSNKYQIPKGYKAVPKTTIKETNFSIYPKANNDIPTNYDYKEEVFQNTKEKDWETFTKKMNLNEKTIYKLLEEGTDIEKLNPYKINEDNEINYSSVGAEGRQKNTEVDNKNRSKLDLMNQKINRLKEHTDNMYLYGVTTKDDEISINSLYKGSFTGNYKPRVEGYTASDVDSVLKLNNFDLGEGNRWAANKLLQYDMPVTDESLIKLQNIKSEVDNLNADDEREKAAEDLQQTETCGDRPLMQGKKVMYSEMDMQEIVDKLSGVTDGVIEEVLDSGKEITIGNLKEIMQRNTELALKGRQNMGKLTSNEKIDQVILETRKAEVNKVEDNIDSNTVSEVKNQINEIRAKLTAEAAQKISEKMPLESTALSKIAKALNEHEEAVITDALNQLEVPATEEHIDTIKNVIQAAKMVKTNIEETIAIQTQTPEATLEEIHKALGAYEIQESHAEKRFGETIKKVEGQIEDFLKEEQLPVTKESVQAAKALIANDLVINKENLEQILPVAHKVNTFIEEMTPYRAATLIKEGVNPYKASLDTTLDWIATSKVPELKGNIAEMIVALEGKGSITEDQKQGMLGFYRILHAVENQKEEVIGYLFKNKSELTMEKLQEATKYVGKKEHIEATIDDNFGELEGLEISKNTAKQKIEESQEMAKKLTDATGLLEKMELPLTPDNMKSVQKLNAILYPFIKNHYKEEIGKFEGMDTLPPSLLEKVETIKKVSPDTIQFMEKQNIPVNINNIYWMQKLIEDPDLYAKMLQENNMLEENLPKDFKQLEDKVKKLLSVTKEKKEDAMKQGDITSYKNHKKLQEMVSLQKEIMDHDGVYQVPFMINGEARLVHLSIKKQNSNTINSEHQIKATIKYATKNMGTLIANVNIAGEKIEYTVSGETEAITNKLKAHSSSLEKMLDTLGYMITKGSYTEVEKENIILSTLSHKYEDSEFEMIV